MNASRHLLPLLLAALLGLPLSAKAEEDLGASLERLAQKCEELNLTTQARATRAWLIDRDPQRHYLFLPQPTDPLQPKPTSSKLERFWYAKFRDLRDMHASHLFDEAEADLERAEYGKAFRLLHEVLRENPDHAQARKILGYHGSTGKWAKRQRPPRARAGTSTHHVFGWRRNAYWRVESEHFNVTTNLSAKAGMELVRELEELYAAWQQLFFGYWNVESALPTRWRGGGVPLGASRQYQVVLFRDREDYVEHLSQIEPQIAKTVGYYLASRKTSYFYGGKDAPRTTRWHEATHQFFQESRSTSDRVGATADFWIVEGAALYMESLVSHNGYVTLGGFDAKRLQYARYRKVSDRFYLPMSDLASLGREAMQSHTDLSRLYSQAAGITHMLMDSKQFGGPDTVVRYLRSVYQRRGDRASLQEAIDQPLPALDTAYDEFLMVGDEQLRFLRPNATLTHLCLARCPVTSEGLSRLKGYEHLEWLDLGYTGATDDVVAGLSSSGTLRQLNLEATRVTDSAMQHVGTMRSLTELDLSGTQVTDEGVAQLTGLKNLGVLWLTATRISDAGIAPLEKLRNLTFLNVSDTAVTTNGLQALQQRLPQLNQQ